MSGGTFTRCGTCGRLLIHGQTCVCGQDYYWTPQWQADERAARAELARGEGVEFDTVDDVVRWLSDEAVRS